MRQIDVQVDAIRRNYLQENRDHAFLTGELLMRYRGVRSICDDTKHKATRQMSDVACVGGGARTLRTASSPALRVLGLGS